MTRLALLLPVLFLLGAVNAEDENPYRKANVGDWAEYAGKSRLAGQVIETTRKKTVAKKTEDEVTLETLVGDAKGAPQTIKLKEKYEPVSAINPGAEIKAVDSGEEKLTVGDKTLDTKWVQYEVTKGADKNRTKIWTSAQVPLDGMVKMESSGRGGK